MKSEETTAPLSTSALADGSVSTAPTIAGVVPEISVIIVSWNARKFLDECLQSLSEGIKHSREVIVVDNASRDGSPEMVTAKYPWVTLIQTGQNLGFSKGNNVGIKHSRGKYIALVNSDVHVLPGCLDRLAEFLENNSDVGMVGPRIMYGDRRLQSSCRRFPGLWNNLCEVLYLNRLFPKSELFAGEHMFYFDYDRVREVEVIVGCFILARRTAVDSFGLLDEDFWMYAEDLDWSRRCGRAGWKLMFLPNAEAIHYCGGSSTNEPLRFSLAQEQSRLLLWRKHHGLFSRVGLRGLAFLRCLNRLTAAGAIWVFAKSRRANAAARASGQIKCMRILLRGETSPTRMEGIS